MRPGYWPPTAFRETARGRGFVGGPTERMELMLDRKLAATTVCGTGERVVAEPYSRETYETTRSWIEQLGVMTADQMGRLGYEEAILV